MKRILAVGFFLPVGAFAQELAEDAYACLDGIGTATTWGQCLNAVFAPCAAHEVGEEAHALCLTGLYDGWFTELETGVAATFKVLPQQGRQELGDILSAWYAFAEEKCATLAGSREGAARASAQVGCQISETLLLANELRRCRAGRSEEMYCAGVKR